MHAFNHFWKSCPKMHDDLKKNWFMIIWCLFDFFQTDLKKKFFLKNIAFKISFICFYFIFYWIDFVFFSWIWICFYSDYILISNEWNLDWNFISIKLSIVWIFFWNLLIISVKSNSHFKKNLFRFINTLQSVDSSTKFRIQIIIF